MAELILGLGHQKTLTVVVRFAEEQLQKTFGAPRKIIMKAPGIDVQALRSGFEGEFDSFNVQLRISGDVVETIKKFAKTCSIPCSVAENNGVFEFSCLAAPPGPEASQKVIDDFSALLHLPEIWRVHGEQFRQEHLSTEALFRALVKFKASDVHLYPDAKPVFRVDNQMRHSEMLSPLSAEQIMALVKEIALDKDWKEFEDHQQCSFTFHQVGLGYSRVSAFIKAGVPHLTIRFLPETIPSFEDLNIPSATMQKLGKLHFGFILVTGMTGSGKSTTVASLIDWINTNSARHILSIEEPVEYIHQNKQSVVSQRDVGIDVATFHDAVRASLRHDPDVIFIGEMRDTDTIRSAINAAATGHLVVSTLHANTASEVITRIVSFFDPVERDLVKLQLRDCVRCIICQRLVPKIGGGRIPAIEVLFNDTAFISDSILAGDAVGLRTGMQQTFSDSFIVEEYLHNLVKQELVTLDDARTNTAHAEVFDQMRKGTYAIPSLESMAH